MSARRTWLLVPLLLVLLTACGDVELGDPTPFTEVNTLDVWMEVREGSVSPTGLDMIYHNPNHREDLFHGVAFYIEKEKDGQWYAYPPQPPHVPGTGPSMAIQFPVYESRTRWVSWEWEYGELTPGHYRYVLDLNSENDEPQDGVRPKYYLAAEFIVEK